MFGYILNLVMFVDVPNLGQFAQLMLSNQCHPQLGLLQAD